MIANANLYAQFSAEFPTDLSSKLIYSAPTGDYSYGEAAQAAARLANALLSLGARPGDRVTVQIEKSPTGFFLYLACLRAGLVYHPLNTAYQANEIDFFLQDAQASLIVCDPAGLDRMRQLQPDSCKNVLTLDAHGNGTLAAIAKTQSDEHICAGNQPDDMAALLYSSGTTGKPKGIVLTHGNLFQSARCLTDLWGFNHNDRLLHALPIYHVHGLFVATGCVLLSGSSMQWLNKFDEQRVIDALPECSVMMGVPTFYTRLLANKNFDHEHCLNMRLFISGSAPLLVETFNEFEARTGHTILERYGMTETNMNTSNPLNGERRAGTVGFPLPGVALRIVDGSSTALACGNTGDLQVKGANVFPGYWQLPEKTAEDFTEDGFFNTGDKAQIDADGYVSIVGRAKDMIISGGLNIYPKEIERVIDEFDGITESAVIGIPDADFGEAVVAVVVSGPNAVNGRDIIDHCRAQLAGFKAPKQVHFIESLPRNAMGKVQKNLLRGRYSDVA